MGSRNLERWQHHVTARPGGHEITHRTTLQPSSIIVSGFVRQYTLTVLQPRVKTGQEVHLRILLKDEAGQTSKSRDYVARVKGPARRLHVSPSGEDAVNRGAKDRPLCTVQYAADRALPGDRILLRPGVYAEAAWLTHGGVAEAARITIEAEQPGTVTLDGAHREKSLIQLDDAPYVSVRNLRRLYFTSAAVYAYRSPHLKVDRCVVHPGLGWSMGRDIFCFYSPYATVTRSLIVGGEIGVYFIESPYATVKGNTCSQFMYAATSYLFSGKGSAQTNNSLAFGGNVVYSIACRTPEELAGFRSDYNNVGSRVAEYWTEIGQKDSDPALWQRIVAEDFKADYPYQLRTWSKGIIGADKQYETLKDWQEASGQDKHSIMADPKYVNPLPPIDRWDWRLKPGSPNIGAGENGATIGALEAAK